MNEITLFLHSNTTVLPKLALPLLELQSGRCYHPIQTTATASFV
jgi:hypothetical protein